jgi:hypothetical protein
MQVYSRKLPVFRDEGVITLSGKEDTINMKGEKI